MADLNDLNTAITTASTKAQASVESSQAALDAVNAAKVRSQNIPGPVDYQPQVDAVGAIAAQADQAKSTSDQAKAVADTILP